MRRFFSPGRDWRTNWKATCTTSPSHLNGEREKIEPSPVDARGGPYRCWLLFFLWLVGGQLATRAEDNWPASLSQMPLGTGPVQLSRTNCAQLILNGFQ